MLRYIGQRLLQMIPILLIVAVLVFTLMELVPGDPVSIMLGDTATEQQIEEARTRLGLDKPFLERFTDFMWNALHLDFGRSYYTGSSVGAELLQRFPRTLSLALFSMIVTVLVGIPIGIRCAIRADSLSDKLWLFITLLGNSIPSFWLALLLVLFFSSKLGILPSSGIGTWKHYVLPVVASSLRHIASVARQTRASMLEVIRADFVTTAKSKGLKERFIIMKHALPNALIPIITVIGSKFSFLLGGTTVIESVFSIPGIGLYIITGIKNRDYPIVRGGILYLALTFSVIMLIVDIIYAFADPRIKARYSSGKKAKKVIKEQAA